jgi:hypothetical protein
MSTDGDERNTSTAHTDADGFPPEGAGQEGGSTLSRVVISRLGWVQRAVSPWVRRALETGQASPGEHGPELQRHEQVPTPGAALCGGQQVLAAHARLVGPAERGPLH